MREELTLKVSEKVEGISDEASYLMRSDKNDNLWLIGSDRGTDAYRFDGHFATKFTISENMGLQVRSAFSAGPKGEVYFAAYQYAVQHPTIICIDDHNATKISNLDLDGNIGISSIAISTLGLVCVFDDFSGIKANDICLLDNDKFVSLKFGANLKKIDSLVAMESGLLILDGGTKKGHLINIEKSKVINSFDTYDSHMDSLQTKSGIITACPSRLEIRDPHGTLVHDISTYGDTANPLSKAFKQISDDDYVNINNITLIDDDTILIHLRERQGKKGVKNFLRMLDLSTMEMVPHSFDGCIKSNQIISECAFDRSGNLWLNQYLNKNDKCKFNVVSLGKKKPDIQNKQEEIFYNLPVLVQS